jgi:hypothetical protein
MRLCLSLVQIWLEVPSRDHRTNWISRVPAFETTMPICGYPRRLSRHQQQQHHQHHLQFAFWTTDDQGIVITATAWTRLDWFGNFFRVHNPFVLGILAEWEPAREPKATKRLCLGDQQARKGGREGSSGEGRAYTAKQKHQNIILSFFVALTSNIQKSASNKYFVALARYLHVVPTQ